MAEAVIPSEAPTVVFNQTDGGVPCSVAYQVGDVLYWDLNYVHDKLRGGAEMSSWKFMQELRTLTETDDHLNHRHLHLRGMKDRRGPSNRYRCN